MAAGPGSPLLWALLPPLLALCPAQPEPPGSRGMGLSLHPPYFNLAAAATIRATATCGEAAAAGGGGRPELYCKLVGGPAAAPLGRAIQVTGRPAGAGGGGGAGTPVPPHPAPRPAPPPRAAERRGWGCVHVWGCEGGVYGGLPGPSGGAGVTPGCVVSFSRAFSPGRPCAPGRGGERGPAGPHAGKRREGWKTSPPPRPAPRRAAPGPAPLPQLLPVPRRLPGMREPLVPLGGGLGSTRAVFCDLGAWPVVRGEQRDASGGQAVSQGGGVGLW